LGTSPFPDHVAFLQRSAACGLAGTAHIAVPAGRRTRLLSTVPGLRKPTEKTGFRPNGPARRSSANFRPLSDGRAARTVLLVHAGGPRDVPAGREPCWRRSSGSNRSGRSPRWCLSWSQRCSRSRFSTSAEISPARKPSVCSAAPFGPRAAPRAAGRPQTRHRSAPRPSPGGFALLQNLSFTGGTGPRIGGCR
jgi:hypothetical protein